MVEDPVPLMDAHRSQARMQSTLLHLIHDVENRLQHIVLALVVGLGVFMVKIVHRRVGGWFIGRQRDDERVFRLPRYARGWQPDTQLLFTANLQALGAHHGADPAPSNDLVRRQPDALKDTHDRPHRASNLNPARAPVAELLEAQQPSSAHARADQFISVVQKHQPLLVALNPGKDGWVSIVGTNQWPY